MFESLFVNALFGGKKYSYATTIVWNVSTDFNDNSLELMGSIVKFIRINFKGEKWYPVNILIVGSHELILEIYRRYKI